MGPNTRWLLEPETSSGAVQSIDNYDMTGDGVKDLIIGRHDGNIEVYAYEEGDESEPILKYSHVNSSFMLFKILISCLQCAKSAIFMQLFVRELLQCYCRFCAKSFNATLILDRK